MPGVQPTPLVDMIDITFDFRSDTPPGKDPDTFSPTLRRYNELLWNKPLPSGAPFKLDVCGPPYYLHHRSELGEFWLSSDAAVPSFLYLPWISDQMPEMEREAFRRIGYTIGGNIVFPAQKVDGKMTINGARGWHPSIKDRFDLTVECIRRHYLDEPSPLSDVLARYADFFGLFGDFPGYVDFFHLQDLVNESTSTVKFFAPFKDFAGSPVPGTLDAYLAYRDRAIEFIESRSQRIAVYVAESPPDSARQPVWASQRFETVLAHAQAVGQREVLEDLLAAGDRLGLHLRPYVASVMFTPPTNRTRTLITVWPQMGGVHMWVSADAFEEFFPEISADEVRRQLGPDGERDLDKTAAREFIAGLARLLNLSPYSR
jgi:hypothetical protein